MSLSVEEEAALAIQPERDAYIAIYGESAVAEYDEVLDYLRDLEQERQEKAIQLPGYSLPQLPDTDVYERLLDAERNLASPRLLVEDYTAGVATYDDELLVIEGLAQVLFTTEHATGHMRLDAHSGLLISKEADYGTAAIGKILQQDTGQSLITPVGRQTSDANSASEHPIKDVMKTFIARDTAKMHISLHGAKRGRVANLTDDRGFDVFIGVGDNPTEETKDAADKLAKIAKNYGLIGGINQFFVTKEEGQPQYNEDGTLRRISFSAANPGTTRSFAQTEAERLGKPLITIQVELSDALRILPVDYDFHPGIDSQRRGTNLAYFFLQESISALNQKK